MDEINALLERIRTEQPSHELQQEVLDLIGSTLTTYRDRLGYWEKDYLARAIGAAATNVHHQVTPTHLWLRLALSNLTMALIPAGRRNEDYNPRRDDFVEALTFAQLAKALEELGGKLP